MTNNKTPKDPQQTFSELTEKLTNSIIDCLENQYVDEENPHVTYDPIVTAAFFAAVEAGLMLEYSRGEILEKVCVAYDEIRKHNENEINCPDCGEPMEEVDENPLPPLTTLPPKLTN